VPGGQHVVRICRPAWACSACRTATR